MSLRDSVDVFGDNLRGFWTGLTQRDKALLLFMTFVLFGFASWFVVGEMRASRDKVRRNLSGVAIAQQQVDILMRQHDELAATATELDARLQAGKGFAALTWLEQIGNEMNISENIRSITPRGTEETDFYTAQIVDMVVDGIDLRQLSELLHKLEYADHAVRVYEARVKKGRKGPSDLDVRLEIAVLRPVGDA